MTQNPSSCSLMPLAPLAYFNGAWFRGDWRPHQQLAAALTWGHLLERQHIRFHCDNLSIVQTWTNQSSKHPGIMELLRTLFFTAAQHSFTVSLVRLPGRLNCIADDQISRFFSLAPQANQATRATSCTEPRLNPW